MVLGKVLGPRLCKETPRTQSTWRGQPGTQLLVLLWLAESKGSTFFFIRYTSKNTALFGRHIREQAMNLPCTQRPTRVFTRSLQNFTLQVPLVELWSLKILLR